MHNFHFIQSIPFIKVLFLENTFGQTRGNRDYSKSLFRSKRSSLEVNTLVTLASFYNSAWSRTKESQVRQRRESEKKPRGSLRSCNS